MRSVAFPQLRSTKLFAAPRATLSDSAVSRRSSTSTARGASFNTTESGFAITPPYGMITREDRAFLLAHLDEAERILKYVEDNAQSLYEPSPPSPLNR